jgi:molybdopterin molybdotransferase
MTGAMVPQGADWVVKIEDTEPAGENRIRITGKASKSNIALKGEDVNTGDIVVPEGTCILPQHIAIMASVGHVMPDVYKKLKTGIISTGDEIVEPDQQPGLSQIRNSNGPQLMAQAARAGADPKYYGIAPDDEEETFEIFSGALAVSDIVILSGGVSMGAFDFIPRVFDRLGVELHFKTVAIQPGKPTVFGTMKDKYIFGLPGNPVSSFTTFELFVRPLMAKVMGGNPGRKDIKLPLGKTYRRKKADRMSWIPVKFSKDCSLLPLEYHGSAHISALVEADAIAAIPAGMTEVKEGELLDARQIS